jgi:type VI protein secretion system component VasK
MFALALLLLIVSVGATVLVLARASEPVTVSMFGNSVSTTAREIFVAGIIAGLLFAIALWLFSRSARRKARKHRERSETERARRTELQRLEAEKAALESRLHDTQRASSSPDRNVTRVEREERVDVRDGADGGGGSSRFSIRDRAGHHH